MRLAVGYVRDRSAAEDVVQETWLTCLRSLDRFEGRSSLKTWIFGIALNVARTRRRKDARVLPFASLFRRDDSDSSAPTVDPRRFGSEGKWRTPPDDWSNVPESHVLSRETLDRVRSAIDRLPPRQREVIILRDVAGGVSRAGDHSRKPAGAAASGSRRRTQGARGVPPMICREVVELMTDYLDGALSQEDRARFEDHIAGCNGCTAYLEQLRRTRSVIGRLAAEPVPAGLEAELLSAFRSWRSGPRP